MKLASIAVALLFAAAAAPQASRAATSPPEKTAKRGRTAAKQAKRRGRATAAGRTKRGRSLSATRVARRQDLAARLKAVPRTAMRGRLTGAAAFIRALNAEMDRLANSTAGPDELSPELRVEIVRRVAGMDRILQRRDGGDYLLNVSTHQTVAEIRASLRALLE